MRRSPQKRARSNSFDTIKNQGAVMMHSSPLMSEATDAEGKETPKNLD